MGFDHFSLYDIDGSAQPYLTPLLNSSFLSYYNRWAPSDCLESTAVDFNFPSCYETMINNQCVWDARGVAEWAMLIHAPDCFLNDDAGMPVLLALLDSMHYTKSSLMMPTYLFEFPSGMQQMPAPQKGSTAASVFTYFNVRACQMLNSHRHLVVVDPHLVHVTRVHEALDGNNSQARLYTASVAVNHYIQMFSIRTATEMAAAISRDGMRVYDNGSVPHCVDEGMYHVSHVVSSLIESYAGRDDVH
jgi:hypothetical protein